MSRNRYRRGLLQWLKKSKFPGGKSAFQGLQKAGIGYFHSAKSRFSGLKNPVIR
jgi:hypothetical protein